MKKIKNETEALRVALKIIDAQKKLLIAYRLGTLRAPAGAIDSLNKNKPLLAEWLGREEL